MSRITKNKFALLALAGFGAAASGVTFAAAEMTVDTKGGIEIFELDKNKYWFKLGGRLFFDQVFFDNDDDQFSHVTNVNSPNFPSGAHIRTARLYLKGGVGNDWVYKFELDMKDNPGNVRADIGEAFVGYNACKNLWFAIGQVSIPFGLENWESSNDIVFMEISMASSAFAPDKGLGLYAEWHGTLVTAAAALYHPQRAGSLQTGDVISSPPIFNNDPNLAIAGTGPFDSDPGSDDAGFGARITFSPCHDEYTVYHAGVSARYESLHDFANNFNYFANLEAFARQTPELFTNIPPNSTKGHHIWGFELAGRWGPLLVQGEYMTANVTRNDSFPPFDLRNPGGDLKYYGYYVLGSYVLTGETRDYDFDSGTFGAVHPACKGGAWELGVRYSFLDFVDNPSLPTNERFFFVDFVPPNAVDFEGNPAPTAGNNILSGVSVNDIAGSAHAVTVGLTWWVNDNVRFLANYIRVNLPTDEDLDILGFRAQVAW